MCQGSERSWSLAGQAKPLLCPGLCSLALHPSYPWATLNVQTSPHARFGVSAVGMRAPRGPKSHSLATQRSSGHQDQGNQIDSTSQTAAKAYRPIGRLLRRMVLQHSRNIQLASGSRMPGHQVAPFPCGCQLQPRSLNRCARFWGPGSPVIFRQ